MLSAEIGIKFDLFIVDGCVCIYLIAGNRWRKLLQILATVACKSPSCLADMRASDSFPQRQNSWGKIFTASGIRTESLFQIPPDIYQRRSALQNSIVLVMMADTDIWPVVSWL
jgi:hypothetical protein